MAQADRGAGAGDTVGSGNRTRRNDRRGKRPGHSSRGTALRRRAGGCPGKAALKVARTETNPLCHPQYVERPDRGVAHLRTPDAATRVAVGPLPYRKSSRSSATGNCVLVGASSGWVGMQDRKEDPDSTRRTTPLPALDRLPARHQERPDPPLTQLARSRRIASGSPGTTVIADRIKGFHREPTRRRQGQNWW